MFPWTPAPQRWAKLEADRTTFMDNCRNYSRLTLPKLLPEIGYNQSQELMQDYQSLGAQAVNHLSNKLMLALFAPSRPFFRLDPGPNLRNQLAELNVSEDQLSAMLSVAEKEAMKIMDQRPFRPKVFEGLKHLIVTGNHLMILNKKPRVLGLANYVCQRAPDGTVTEILTKESYAYGTLSAEIRAICPESTDPDKAVCMYNWIKLQEDGRYKGTQWVEDQPLGEKYTSVWTADKLPYRAITWDLASGDHYGTGLVEQYVADLSALSMMSEATVHAAILASEYRWLVNPAGQTKPEDFQRSRNGSALPGIQGDVTLVQNGNSANLQVNISIQEQYINRIGRGFLLGSAVTRDAERVTAEEIRMTADELETSLGGAYSRISLDMQPPIVLWLMDESKQSIGKGDIKPTIVTGLAALSRIGDLDNLKLLLTDMAQLDGLSPELKMRLRLDTITAAFCAARGLSTTQYLRAEEEVQQEMQQQREQALQMQAAQAQIEQGAAQ